MESLEQDNIVLSCNGRYVFPEDASRLDRQRQDEQWMPRKLRAARAVARWLTRLASVRFVALCNTTALGHARDESDLDFFVITRAGTLMQTRGLAALPYKLLGRRPGSGDERDAVCLSYFVTDDGLNLSSHMLQSDDPYFRYWFLSLLPIYDDGISGELWKANLHITCRHPLARPWSVSSDLATPLVRCPSFPWLESFAREAQNRRFPHAIRELMNKDTRVMVTDTVLKFHVEDGREKYRQKYEDICRQKNLV